MEYPWWTPKPAPKTEDKPEDTPETQLDKERDLFGSPQYGSPIKVSSDEEFTQFPDRLCEDEMESPFKHPFVGMTSTLHDFLDAEPPKFDTTPESKKVPTGDLCKVVLARQKTFKNDGEDLDDSICFCEEDTLKWGDVPPTPRKRPRGPAEFGVECSPDRQVRFRRLNAAEFN